MGILLLLMYNQNMGKTKKSYLLATKRWKDANRIYVRTYNKNYMKRKSMIRKTAYLLKITHKEASDYLDLIRTEYVLLKAQYANFIKYGDQWDAKPLLYDIDVVCDL